jgi:hypothetical protein
VCVCDGARFNKQKRGGAADALAEMERMWDPMGVLTTVGLVQGVLSLPSKPDQCHGYANSAFL